MISGSTRLAAVIGSPVRHSLSPALHNAAFAELGLDWVYVALPVAEGRADTALDAMRRSGMARAIASAVTRKCDAAQTTLPCRTRMACGVSCLRPSRAAMCVETSRCVCTVTTAYRMG